MAKHTGQPVVHYLKDYTPPGYLIDKIDLTFDIQDPLTLVTSRLVVQKNQNAPHANELTLDGKAKLVSLRLDGETLPETQYTTTDEGLVLTSLPDSFILEIVTEVDPFANTELMGLYASNGNLFTQCEPEGFRNITYYLDRPDVMSRFSTTIIADKQTYPILLSNGNKIGEGAVDKKRHWVKWSDPYRKPSYLFALVAGQLVALNDSFVTRSGREVALQVWTEAADQQKTEHAMASIKRAMRWDEERFNLEYDLDIFMIVAVGDFNMGAMENKGLNIFNTKYVLATPETATDADFSAIEGVIGHEYFHNWTGNRVTCRDWFQLSLKEGLTVFRDQEFTSDMESRAVKRIEDVQRLRANQFPEDAGPTAHPIRPESYIEMNNFYTTTVYEKGAEVVRMYQTLLGKEGFANGLVLYFKRHDGHAVTCDDFRMAMADANQVDLSQFARWYSQAGTPEVRVTSQYDPVGQEYTLHIEQSCPPTPGQPTKEPFHIPLTVALIGADGNNLPLQLKGQSQPDIKTERILELKTTSETFTFVQVTTEPTPSLLRGFSAPVNLKYGWTDQQLTFLMMHDDDAFSRWEAAQALAKKTLIQIYEDLHTGQQSAVSETVITAYQTVLKDLSIDPAFKAFMLALPTEHEMLEWLDEADPVVIADARQLMQQALSTALRHDWRTTFTLLQQDKAYQFSDNGMRTLKNHVLSILNCCPDEWTEEAAHRQFFNANNMTDQFGALRALRDSDSALAQECLIAFATQWQSDMLVMDKYFALIASRQTADALTGVQTALSHSAFNLKNPNKARSLIGSFGRNLRAFHAADGQGYRFIADKVSEIDQFNPQVASRLVQSFNRWKKVDQKRQILMKQELVKLSEQTGLSKDVYEIVSRLLG